MPVLGIGGIFFRAQDPERLTAWYRDHLGVGPGLAAPDAGDPEEWTWKVQGGPLAFAHFDADTDYWSTDRQIMLNLRVSDLDRLLDDLRAGGIAVTVKAEWDSPETGRFARIHDPEGNPVELWEPPVD
ncbi:VOC family protein [Aeromicrobium ginsengisoli]|uniref:VOC family protein n=1 Tax=Aeromicrobium ginsengisoli TaxID=363867 RepID=A0A5M4FE54_9ACTN|nr:VOC family protein [Aeromicrobium ginsengisoli]KAA1397607.1 VOC family protein [Aeromicrobium ginsengisoli]